VSRQLGTYQSEKICLTNATTASMGGSAPPSSPGEEDDDADGGYESENPSTIKTSVSQPDQITFHRLLTNRRATKLETVRKGTETSEEIAVEGKDGIESRLAGFTPGPVLPVSAANEQNDMDGEGARY
jgi:hypothetical protein